MSLVTRTGKGSKLTIAEMDGNLIYLENLSSSKRDLTYNQLMSEILNNTLKVGEFINITDYKTSHNIYDGITVLEEIHIDTIEPLLVSAISSNKLDVRVKSSLFPKDIIHYDVNDNICEDGITPRTGKITFRQDHLGNETHYDFRGVVFRRWKLDFSGFTLWVSGGAFTKGDMIVNDNKLYYCVKSISGSTDTPDVLTSNFYYIIDNQLWLCWNTFGITVPNPVSGSGIVIPVNNTVSQDFYTFSDTLGNDVSESNNFVNNKLGRSSDYVNFPYNSIVFIEESYNGTCNNIFGADCFDMTFYGGATLNNVFGNYINQCIFGSMAQYNIFQNYIGFITVGNDFTHNTLHGNIYNIVFGNYCAYNIFDNNCGNNIFANNVSACVFGKGNQSNIFGSYNLNIIFGNSNQSNIFGDNNSNITFGNTNNNNVFGDSNTNITFGCDNINNTFGNNNWANRFGYYNSNHVFTPINLVNNEFSTYANGSGINYSTATHLKNDYHCTIQNRVGDVPRLMYLNASSVLTVVNINA